MCMHTQAHTHRQSLLLAWFSCLLSRKNSKTRDHTEIHKDADAEITATRVDDSRGESSINHRGFVSHFLTTSFQSPSQRLVSDPQDVNSKL